MFQSLAASRVREMVSIELGSVAQEVFLYAERLLVGANQDDDKGWMGLPVNWVKTCLKGVWVYGIERSRTAMRIPVSLSSM